MRRWVGVALAAAVVAGGCAGDGSGEQGSASSATTAPAPPAGAVGADPVWQVGTIAALSEGAYAGAAPVGDLTAHGDLGLGTFDGLDGELVLVDGTVWQVRPDGVPTVAPDDATTPFAQVVAFDADRVLAVPSGTTCEALPDWLDGQLGDVAAPLVALRFDGELRTLTTRSVPAQVEPYPPLADVVEAEQVTFERADAAAVLVGFRTAAELESVSPPGVHLHGVTDDGEAGGHVLACEVAEGELSVDLATGLALAFAPGP